MQTDNSAAVRRKLGISPPIWSIFAWTALVTACGSGSSGGMTSAPTVAPAIAAQPLNQSTPMGLAATFSVAASGTSPRYQWKKNGMQIAGATNSSYVTPPTVFADTGASFTVEISNSAGSIESAAATLTVTARAPLAGDLRFQQVDSSATVNGYGNAGTGESTAIAGRMGAAFTQALGTPFYVGPGICVTPPVNNGVGCAWFFQELPLPVSATPTLAAGYASDFFSNFQQDLQSPSWLAINATSPIAPGSVIRALDLEPDSNLFSIGWVQSAQSTGFDLSVQTVALANLPNAASLAGASSRVITAISNNGGEVTFVSYGWQADLATVYEVQVVTASPANAPAAATGLADQGYIVTATGLADGSGDVFLVGTRVQGDTMPRSSITAQGSSEILAMWQGGYATVGVISNFGQGGANATTTFLGER